MIPPRVILRGDILKAQGILDHTGKLLLGLLKADMAFQDLQDLFRTRRFPDGSWVKATSCYGLDTIEVFATSGEQEKKTIKRVIRCLVLYTLTGDLDSPWTYGERFGGAAGNYIPAFLQFQISGDQYALTPIVVSPKGLYAVSTSAKDSMLPVGNSSEDFTKVILIGPNPRYSAILHDLPQAGDSGYFGSGTYYGVSLEGTSTDALYGVIRNEVANPVYIEVIGCGATIVGDNAYVPSAAFYEHTIEQMGDGTYVVRWSNARRSAFSLDDNSIISDISLWRSATVRIIRHGDIGRMEITLGDAFFLRHKKNNAWQEPVRLGYRPSGVLTHDEGVLYRESDGTLSEPEGTVEMSPPMPDPVQTAGEVPVMSCPTEYTFRIAAVNFTGTVTESLKIGVTRHAVVATGQIRRTLTVSDAQYTRSGRGPDAFPGNWFYCILGGVTSFGEQTTLDTTVTEGGIGTIHDYDSKGDGSVKVVLFGRLDVRDVRQGKGAVPWGPWQSGRTVTTTNRIDIAYFANEAWGIINLPEQLISQQEYSSEGYSIEHTSATFLTSSSSSYFFSGDAILMPVVTIIDDAIVYTYSVYGINTDDPAKGARPESGSFKHRVIGIINLSNPGLPAGHHQRFILDGNDDISQGISAMFSGYKINNPTPIAEYRIEKEEEVAA